MPLPSVWPIVALVGIGVAVGPRIVAQSATPTARLIAAPTLRLPGSRPTQFATADSNSPALWTMEDDLHRLRLLTSFDGYASVSEGPSLAAMSAPVPVAWDAPPTGGVWFESTIADDSGAWYGYYHNEVPPTTCEALSRVVPRIGAARSLDGGRTWQDLGIILQGPAGAEDCQSRNQYFVGGVGDFTAVLDRSSQDAYFFFSTYGVDISSQGVAVARMTWADRDAPVGRVSVWADGAWLPPSAATTLGVSRANGLTLRDVDGPPEEDEDPPEDGPPPTTDAPAPVEEPISPWLFPAAAPIFPTTDSWHDGQRADAFWGPSVHWNTHLQQYVMLLNRTRDVDWSPDGIYVSFSPVLDDPRRWSPPQRILEEGSWYPQVMGLEPGEGTDKVAGQVARFFMAGISRHQIVFERY